MAPGPASIVYQSASHGPPLAARHWRANGRPRGTVVLLHGIVSHGGWYEPTGQALAERGYDVYLPDRRGSGLNSYTPSDVAHWSVWRDDVLALLRRLDGTPPVLCGISWGAKLAVVVAAAEPKSIAGLALLNPGLFAYQAPGPAARVALRLSRWLPVDRRLIDIPLKDPALFTGSRHWQDYIARDPLCIHKVTVRAAREDVALTEQADAAANKLTMPILVTLSGRDRIVDNAATLDFLSRVPATDKTVLEYRGAAHTLEFEPDPAPYHADLARWVGRILPGETKS
jgi:alpha-beta hydrolase superfamily lysophospholipase